MKGQFLLIKQDKIFKELITKTLKDLEKSNFIPLTFDYLKLSSEITNLFVHRAINHISEQQFQNKLKEFTVKRNEFINKYKT
jgi:hypothetical protein